jgi:hypothetical protein
VSWKQEWKPLAIIAAVFVAVFYLPVGVARFDSALSESLHLVKWYAREHVILCLIPAFFIAGAISVFISQASVMRYLGATAHKVLAVDGRGQGVRQSPTVADVKVLLT